MANIEPYDIQNHDNFASIEDFDKPIIDKYSQNFIGKKPLNPSFIMKNSPTSFPIFIVFDGHTKYLNNSFGYDMFYLLESSNLFEIMGQKTIELTKQQIEKTEIIKQYMNLYEKMNIKPKKVILCDPISFEISDFFDILNENNFLKNTINIDDLVCDLQSIQKSKLLLNQKQPKIKLHENSTLKTKKSYIVYNEEFHFTLILNDYSDFGFFSEGKTWLDQDSSGYLSTKISDKNLCSNGTEESRANGPGGSSGTEFKVVWSSEDPIVDQYLIGLYDKKFWKDFSLHQHSTLINEYFDSQQKLEQHKHNLELAFKNMFITDKEVHLGEFKELTLETIYNKIKDRLNTDYGFPIYLTMKFLAEIIVEFRQADGNYRGIIDRYDYQFSNDLESKFAERSKIYNPMN